MEAGNNREGKGNHLTRHILSFLIKALIASALLLILFSVIRRQFFNGSENAKEEKPAVTAASQLEDVLKTSELSTYQVTYNGVAAVNDENGDLLYNVAYEAKVSIGLDMDGIKVTEKDASEGSRKLIVTLPAVEISDVAVDAGSLDYIFENSSANTPDVSITALPACKADAQSECESNDVMYGLAKENAIHTIYALTQPFLAQHKEYTLEIQGEGGYRYE